MWPKLESSERAVEHAQHNLKNISNYLKNYSTDDLEIDFAKIGVNFWQNNRKRTEKCKKAQRQRGRCFCQNLCNVEFIYKTGRSTARVTLSQRNRCVSELRWRHNKT